MNAHRLLAHYEFVADAPNAIARLRRFILDLAVRGKLVPQDVRDEPASRLLRNIATEKARLVEAGRIKDRTSLPVDANADTPFLIPPTWEWVRFAEVSDFSAGRTPSRYDTSLWNNGDHAWVSIADMENRGILAATKETVSDTARERVFGSEPESPGTILMSFKLTIGKITRLGLPAFHNEAIISIRPHLAEIDPYLFKVLPQFAQQGDTKGAIKGATLNRDSISNILLPLPPLAEQRRIVGGIDALMSLCDKLEAARAEREATRDRLAAASLARLNTSDPETFQADVHFALESLTVLTTRPDQIKALRQTILNLAMRGKLVAYDAENELASDLLSRAREAKNLLRKQRHIGRNEESEYSTSFAEKQTPKHWSWAYLSDFALVLGGKRLPAGAAFSDVVTDYKYIRVTDMKEGTIISDKIKYIDFEVQKEIAKYTIDKEDLYITIAGTIGEVGTVPDVLHGHNLTENAAKIVFLEIDRKFLALAMRSNDVQNQFAEKTKQMAQPKLALKRILGARVPIPPLAEQKQIVVQVEALMMLCDQLEISLTAAAATRRCLLDALLAEALTLVEDSSGVVVAEWIADAEIAKPKKAVETERSALILMLAYERHRSARRDKTFGHVKAQKILHLVEAEANFDLGRTPIRDAAGPNDFHHMLDVEKWARKHQRFDFEKNGTGYSFKPLSEYKKLLETLDNIKNVTRVRIEKIIDLFIPMDMETSEVFATVYAAWNNLLIEGKDPAESDIVRAAREEWHPRKLKIPREKFVAALRHLKKSDLVPSGRGKFVPGTQQQDMFIEQ